MEKEEAIKVAIEMHGWLQTDREREALETLIPELRESEDERIRKGLVNFLQSPFIKENLTDEKVAPWIAYLEKQKDASKAIEAVERIDKYIDEHLANAHDMKDSNPDKKYYRGWDDALGKMAGILQDVYSWEKQKEPEDVSASTMIPSCWAEEPSLQKEDDETVKKIITDSVFYQYGAGVEYKAVLDYLDRLEKQKEQKEIPLMNGDADLYFDEWNQQNQNPTKRQCFEEGMRYAQRLQKEQKPVEWNKATINGEPIPTENQSVDIPLAEWSEDIIQKAVKEAGLTQHQIDWFKTNVFPPKQEWSEEDRRIMDGIQLVLESWDRTHSSIAGLPSLIPSYISWLKARRPQSRQKRQIKEGDKVSIHCRKDRKEGIITIYDGKVGEVIHVWDAKRNPWGHIGVRLDNGCNNGFYEDELEVLDEPSWKPSGVCYGAKGDPDPAGVWKPSEEQMNAFKRPDWL